MPAVDHALIHRARIHRDERTGQKAWDGSIPTTHVIGEWFPARRMTKRHNPERRDEGNVARTVTGYSLMWGEFDEAGAPIDPPRASDRVEVDDGRGDVRMWEVTGPVLVFDTGAYVFGGQAEIVVIGDAA